MYAAAGAAFIQILEIVWINLLLSGDNAIAIALACRSLPPRQRRLGILLGTGAAVALRLLFTFVVVRLLGVPTLELIGAAILLWIAIKLLDVDDGIVHVAAATTLWRAVRTIAIADAFMSLDNVIAIAAAANGSLWLIAFGLLLSIPLIAFGADLVTTALDRFPILLWAGAAMLGWIAAQLALGDPVLAHVSTEELSRPAGAAGALFVVANGLVLRRSRAARSR